MMFQMLAGDVPFKGSSIPAIMKKHISDPPPSFEQYGVTVSPDLERAVNHTLEKDPNKRTASVDVFVRELQGAVGASPFIHSSVGSGLPVSTVKITSRPPNSSVYMDNVAVGETRQDDGLLMLEGIQSGNHHLRVSKDGFYDWLGDIVCDGKPQEVVAELREGRIPDPIQKTIGSGSTPGAETVANRGVAVQDSMAQTVQQSYAGGTGAAITAPEEKRKGFFSPLVLGLTGLLALFLIGIVGLSGAYMMGLIGGGSTRGNATPQPTPVASPPVFKPEMVSIPGGTFSMGRVEGRDNERPPHQVDVKPFKMDKTEITNAEYFAFVSETSYHPVPAHWVNDKPVLGTERMPVRFVNIADVDAFIEWRSKRDGVTYRLPTEAEWEFAARNGGKNNLYPWGDSFQAKCAVTDKENTEPEPVGSMSCPDEWGVVDLIGNVYEWTSSKAALYPGSKGTVKPTKEPYYMIRGGGAFTKSVGEYGITATFRQEVEGTKRDKELGFRLVS
jgi:formylglycine-generating enzyme required for sulfatase activity